MRVIKTFTRTVAANEVIELPLCGNKEGDNVVGEVYIDIPTNNTINVSGSVNGTDWHVLKVTNMCDLSVAAAISTAGYYLVPAAGLAKLKLTCTGAGDVTIKETF